MILIIGLGSVFFRYYSAIEQFKSSQENLAQRQLEVSKVALEERIGHLRRQMNAVFRDHFFSIDLKELMVSDDLQSQLHEHLVHFFPRMQSYAFLNAEAELVGGDQNFLLGEMCLHDVSDYMHNVKAFSSAPPYTPILHPQPNRYHFDIMIPIEINSEQSVFLMSFSIETLSKVLKDFQFAENELYVLLRGQNNLIEFDQHGGRDLMLPQVRLTKHQLERVYQRLPVEGTRWELVVLKSPRALQQFEQTQRFDLIAFMVVGMVLWLFLLISGLRFETRRKLWAQKLEYLSRHDELTGLVNRRELSDYLEAILDSEMEQNAGIMFLDLNDFKPLNDTYGHACGDRVLQVVAKRLKSAVGEEDLVCRLGGDEFVILLPSIGTGHDAYKKLTELSYKAFQLIHDPIVFQGNELKVRVSIGTLLITEEDKHVSEVLRKADYLMYQAKTKGKAGGSLEAFMME